MCKGKSLIATKYEIYESIISNSHEEIKCEHNIKDVFLVELCPIELFPIGKKIDSENIEDWEFVFENKPNWFDENEVKERVFNYLINKVLPRWRNDGITEGLDLSQENYEQLPDFGKIKIQELNCYNNHLTSLTVPEGIQKLFCANNQLTSLTVPEGIQKLFCYNNQLTSLTVPEGIQKLECSYNQLTSFKVPKGIQKLFCYNNQLTSLIVPEGIQELECSNNKLTSLTVPEGIQKLNCSYNKLTSLIVPKGIQELECSYNHRDLIINKI
jgi:Leucine-rich repeat (LRR) protein